MLDFFVDMKEGTSKCGIYFCLLQLLLCTHLCLCCCPATNECHVFMTVYGSEIDFIPFLTQTLNRSEVYSFQVVNRMRTIVNRMG
jgi:hypothetical protein